ncbi:MAG: hypothetical protein ACOYXM_17815 [Actinomycetota bacterium]
MFVVPRGVGEAASDAPGLMGGGTHSCAVAPSSTVYCWGLNSSGQIGDGTTTTRKTPVSVLGLSGVTALAAGEAHTCALLTTGAVKCWGSNSYGQLGDGTLSTRLTPTTVSALSGVTAIAASKYHTCALLSGGTVRCWGYNVHGEAGDGTVTNRRTPVSVVGLTGVAAITAGNWHTCARLATGTAKCWGSNLRGQLGDGTFKERRTPVSVVGLSGISALEALGSSTCAIKSGTVRCWGLNHHGQLGDGTITNRTKPVPVVGLSGVGGLAGGLYHACARMTAGTAKCWGSNSYGQLGDGTRTERRTPVSVSGLTNVANIAAGASHTLARLSTGGVRAWGANGSGQLGDGTLTTTRKTAVAVIVPTSSTSLGKTTITFPHPSGSASAVQDQVGLAVDASGRIIVAGADGDSTLRQAAARLTAGLHLDDTFASNGKIVLQAGVTGSIHAAAIDTHGRILLGGRANGISGPGAAEDFTIWRLNANGVPDSTFGSGGLATVDFGFNDSLSNMVVLPDDSVVAVGGGASPASIVVAKLLPNGTLDPTFGVSGRFTWTLAGTSTSGTSLIMQPDGKLIVIGAIEPEPCPPNCNIIRGVVLRLDADGTLDTTFGDAGAKTLQFFAEPSRSVPYALTLQPDGKIVVAGYVWRTFTDPPIGVNYETFVARFNPNGAPDTSFGNGGLSLTDVRPATATEVPSDIAIDSLGRILVSDSDSSTGQPYIERLLPNGQRDYTYGVDGLAISFIDPTQEVLSRARMRILADDSLVIAGGNGANMTVAHLNPSGTALVVG